MSLVEIRKSDNSLRKHDQWEQTERVEFAYLREDVRDIKGLF